MNVFSTMEIPILLNHHCLACSSSRTNHTLPVHSVRPSLSDVIAVARTVHWFHFATLASFFNKLKCYVLIVWVLQTDIFQDCLFNGGFTTGIGPENGKKMKNIHLQENSSLHIERIKFMFWRIQVCMWKEPRSRF